MDYSHKYCDVTRNSYNFTLLYNKSRFSYFSKNYYNNGIYSQIFIIFQVDIPFGYKLKLCGILIFNFAELLLNCYLGEIILRMVLLILNVMVKRLCLRSKTILLFGLTNFMIFMNFIIVALRGGFRCVVASEQNALWGLIIHE